jgi:general secretion pathway protein A
MGVAEPPKQRARLVDVVQDALYQLDQTDVTPVLMIEEAQMIPGKSVFDELRLLTNFQLDDRNLLALILVGQPELGKRLARPGYEALRQRIGIRYHLEALDEQEVGEYVDFRTRIAGRAPASIANSPSCGVSTVGSRWWPRITRRTCCARRRRLARHGKICNS